MLPKILKLACLAPLAVGLCQCDGVKPKAKAPSPYATSVRIAYTPMAHAAMVREKDTLVLNAYYYGEPTPQGLAKADAVQRLGLSDERYGWTIDAHLVHVDGNVDTSLLPYIRGEPQLLVHAYSVKPDATQDELIHCKTWIGTVKESQARPPLIACELENGDKDSADDMFEADEASSSASSQ